MLIDWQMYEHEHNKKMSTNAIAQLISVMLYYKRFFPYYVSNVLAGIDSDGKGCVYTYDPVGHCERESYGVGGSSSALLQPLLDNHVISFSFTKLRHFILASAKGQILYTDVIHVDRLE